MQQVLYLTEAFFRIVTSLSMKPYKVS